MFQAPEKPYLGVAYYPEDWPDEEMDKDIARMKEIGVNTARIAEFAWHRMEPHPGEFDFSYFHKVVDKLAAAGIAVVLGTPTATPPRWLERLYPDVMAESENGRVFSHGGRRHCCSNNPHYDAYSLRIVEKMAQEFADDPAVIGWQIDNEIYSFGNGCFCPNCQGKFRERLRKKYKTIDSLNQAWNLNLFSQWYDDFSEIPAPRDAWHNPHLIQEWKIFQNDSHVEFVHRQAEILHKYVKVPVGTDTMPINGMDYRKLTEKLDIVQFNHYNVPENLYRCAFWFDYLRTLKEHPFWNTETATCWNGSANITQSIKPEGYCRANSWLPIALGGEANMYWLWRTHWAGHELVHGAVIDSSGRDMHTVGEVKDVARGFHAASRFLTGTRVRPDAAIHFTSLSWNMHESQSVVEGWEYMPTVQDTFYRPMTRRGLRPDVIDSGAALDSYKLIFSPMVMSLDDRDLSARMAQWVKDGGVWVVGPLTDVRSADGTRYRDRFHGMLESLTGARWAYNAPDRESRIQAAWQDGEAFQGDTWYEMWDADDDALVKVTGGHSAIEGKALVSLKPVGKGWVLLLGTLPSEKDMDRILRLVCEKSGVALPQVEGDVMVCPRRGEAGEGLVLVEYGCGEAAVTLDAPMTDLLTGRKLQGKIHLKPYDVLVLQA
ncbi:MAG: beta-galactosidase [Eubacteriales bacterium]|nr:beta-galactosidase [Eubacteriales bacterium]